MSAYNPKVTPWMVKAEALPGSETTGQLAFLLRFAILAPSTHNTQPWKFSVGHIGHDEVKLFTDWTRWLNVADADQRELHVSAGCALENLLIAAEHFGFDPQVTYFPRPVDDTWIATVQFTQGGHTPAHHRHLFDCIPARYTNHKPYDGRPVDDVALETMRKYVIEAGVHLFTSSDMALKREVDELVIEADARQFADAAFRSELSYWIGQGVFGTSWLVSKLGQVSTWLVDQGKAYARKDSDVLMSSPVLAAIITKVNDRVAQVKAGQVFERLHLLATYFGISVQPMNQVLQVPELKNKLAGVVSTDGDAIQMVFRMGYAEPEPEHTPRRELGEMMA
jgi:nitroreductase